MPGRYPKVKDSNHAYYLRNKIDIAASRYAWAKAQKAKVLAHYGGACPCGSTLNVRLEKLPTLAPGAQTLRGGVLVKWIIDNGFPQGFRLRCNACVKDQKLPAAAKCKRWRETVRTPAQVLGEAQANLEASARYRKNHPDKRLETKRNRRAAKLSTGTVTTAEWERVKTAADHKCVACHREVRLTMDHVVPLVKGGPHTIENIQPLCHSCNSRKNVKDHDYRTPEMLQRLGLASKKDEGEDDE
jgi:5-methylcytosine-specific restriction endonuclease McrA